MTVDQLPGYLKHHWPKIREDLLNGSYKPSPVRRKEIPKPGGGVRLLGIPTVLDRLIQQAIAQVFSGDMGPHLFEFKFWIQAGKIPGPRSPLLSNIVLDELDKVGLYSDP